VPAGVPVVVIAGVDPPPQATQEISKSTVAARTARLKRTLRRRIAAREESVASTSSHATHGMASGPMPPGGSSRRVGPASERAVVVTVTVGLATSVPSRVTEDGEMEHVAADGAPVQLRPTCWLKPPTGVTLSV